MTDAMEKRGNGLQIFRTVLEGVIILALGWTGSSLVQVKTDTAVIKSQVASVQPALNKLEDLRIDVSNHETRLNGMEDDIKELQSVRGLK